MPIFEFECPKGHITEKLVRTGTGNDTDRIACPRCIATARRILSPTKTTFKMHDRKAIKK